MIAERLDPANGARGSFRGSVTYVRGILGTRPKHEWAQGVASVETAAFEMDARATLSNAWDPVEHWVLSYAAYEEPTVDMMEADVRRFMTTNGMTDHQFYAGAHDDTDNTHVHVVASRISERGIAAPCSFSKARTERMCATIAIERGWQVVEGRHNRDLYRLQAASRLGEAAEAGPAKPIPYRVDERSVQRLLRTGELPWPDTVRPMVMEVASTAGSWQAFKAGLAPYGIVIKHVIKRGQGKTFHGIAFAGGDAPDAPGCSASAISDDVKYAKLAERFGPYPAQDAAPAIPIPQVEAANGRADRQPPANGRIEAARTKPPRGNAARPSIVDAQAVVDGLSAALSARQPRSVRQERRKRRGDPGAEPSMSPEWENRGFSDSYKRYCSEERQRIKSDSEQAFRKAWQEEKRRRQEEWDKTKWMREIARDVIYMLFKSRSVRKVMLGIIKQRHEQRVVRERNEAKARWIVEKKELGEIRSGKPIPFDAWLRREGESNPKARQHADWIEGLVQRKRPEPTQVGFASGIEASREEDRALAPVEAVAAASILEATEPPMNADQSEGASGMSAAIQGNAKDGEPVPMAEGDETGAEATPKDAEPRAAAAERVLDMESRKKLAAIHMMVVIGSDRWDGDSAEQLASYVRVSKEKLWSLAHRECKFRFGHWNPKEIDRKVLNNIGSEVRQKAADAGLSRLVHAMDQTVNAKSLSKIKDSASSRKEGHGPK